MNNRSVKIDEGLLRALFVLFIGVCVCQGQHETEFHFSRVALKMPLDLDRRVQRMTWYTLPHLYEKDAIDVSVCLETRSIIVFNNITYSNDGANDTIAIIVDGARVGSFNTHSLTDWGNIWNDQYKSGFIGRTGMLSPGRHNITIKVEASRDCYGVELWDMHIRVFTAVNDGFWCGSGYTLAPKKWECLPESERQKTERSPAPITTAPPTTTTLPSTFVNVTQHTYTSNCLDKRNVNVKFTTSTLAGMTITARQENIPQATDMPLNVESRLCDSDIWQIGTVDGDNKEFQSIYPGKSIDINITNVANPEDKFPAKLLPFVTTDISIHFAVPKDLKMEKGSAFLALGLVNLTKPADIGLRYYDHSLHSFSDIHILKFTPEYQVMGWNIPQLGDEATTGGNTIHLHFQSEANVIMFDFLKLNFNKRDERKYSTVISRNGRWRVKGQRYATSTGMRVVVDDLEEGLNMEDVVLLYQVSDFGRYETVLRIHANGLFFPYKTYPVSAKLAERMIIDVSGFFFPLNSHPSAAVVLPTAIRSVHIDTTTDAVTTNYVDGSTLKFVLTATPQETKIQVINLKTASGLSAPSNAQSVVYTSTYVNKYYAGVDKVVAGGIERSVTENLADLSGRYSFTMKQSSQSNLFYANTDYQINFFRSHV